VIAAPSALQQRLERERQLRELTTRIHTLPLDELMVKIRDDVRRLLDCERVLLYALDAQRNELFARAADGTELRMPVNTASLAGCVAVQRRGLNIASRDSGGAASLLSDRDRQVLAVPVMRDRNLYGVLLAANTRDGAPFDAHDQEIIAHLAETLAVALQNQERMNIRSSPHDYLLRAKLVSPEQLDRASAAAQQEGRSVEHVLAARHAVPRAEIARSLAEYYRCEVVFFTPELQPPRELLARFTVDYLKHHLFVPLRSEGTTAVVAMSNPRALTLCDDIARRLGGVRLVACVSTREDILAMIDHFAAVPAETPRPPSPSLSSIVEEIQQQRAAEMAALARPEEQADPARANDEGMVLLVNQLIEQTVDAGASDLHIEPVPGGDVAVRVRVDGSCREHARLPQGFGRNLIARIKIMAGLDIADRRLPQDGKIRYRDFGSRDIELRVSTMPTAGGAEDCVLRVLASSRPQPLGELGLLPDTLAGLRAAIESPYGIVLCVGPTGSGKTTTLHSALAHLNKPDVKIWTAEDPVEITQPGLRQVQVQSKIGLTFERALRGFLRLDPDVIMIGEMRDLETSAAAVEASLTGHLVLSTLHTNSAPETVTRMLDIGLDPFAFGDALVAVLAQRLLRTACSACRQIVPVSDGVRAQLREEYGNDAAFDALEVRGLAEPRGCPRCAGTGYRGRTGIHELMRVDDEIRQLVFRRAQSPEIRAAACRKGMVTLRQDGVRKVLLGTTDLNEVRSACTK